MNVHLQLNPPTTATGQPITIHVSLTTGMCRSTGPADRRTRHRLS